MLTLTVLATNQSLALDQGRLTIGRDASNTLHLQHEDVSGFHAELHCEKNGIYLVDLGSANGTFINGKPLQGRQRLQAWDTLAFASVTAEITDDTTRRPTQVSKAITESDLASAVKQSVQSAAPAQVNSATSAWKLVGPSGSHPLKNTTTIGRQNADIVLNSVNVSRHHAQIVVQGDTVTVKDGGSSNGTFVNGTKVTEQVLKSGDKIAFDIETFTVHGPEDTRATQVRPAIDKHATQVRHAVHSDKAVTQPAVEAGKTKTGTRVSQAVTAELNIIKGATKQSIALSNREYTIGRTDANAIVLAADSVSSQHAKLAQSDAGWRITDTGSTNGTYVNGKRVRGMVLLQHGASIRFGEVEATFNDAGQSSATKATSAVTAQVNAIRKNTLPAWSYGVLGFMVVALILGLLMFDVSGPSPAEGQLQAGRTWQVQLPQHHRIVATPAIGDINNDGFLDILVADSRGFITALDGAEGKQIFQVEVPEGIQAPVAIDDITGDGNPDIVIASMQGFVAALDGKGQFLWRSDDNLKLGFVTNKPKLMDVNNNGVKEVVVATSERGLVALNGNRGWELWNTSENTHGIVVNTPMAKDVNGDGVINFVSMTDSGQLSAHSTQHDRVWTLWSEQLSESSKASPALARVDQRNLIIVATKQQGVLAIDASSGRTVWSSLAGYEFIASPLVADFNGDGQPNVLVTARDGNLFILDARYGDEVNSGRLPGEFIATPAMYDVQGNGIPELFFHDRSGQVLIVDSTRLRPIVQLTGSGQLVASPLLADVNNDGLLDIVTASVDGTITVYSLNRTVRKGQLVWGSYLGQTL